MREGYGMALACEATEQTNLQQMIERISGASMRVEKVGAQLNGKIGAFTLPPTPSPGNPKMAEGRRSMPPAWDEMRERLDALHNRIGELEELVENIRP